MYHTEFDLNGWQDLLDSDMGLFDDSLGESTLMNEGSLEYFETDYSPPLSEQEESVDPLSTCSNTSEVSDKQPSLDPERTSPQPPTPTPIHFQLQHLAPQPPTTETPAADQPIKTTPPCERCGREFKCLAGRKTHLKFCTGIDYAPTVRHRNRDELKEKRKRRLEKRIAKQNHRHHHHQVIHEVDPQGLIHPVPLASHYRGKRAEAKDFYVTDAHMAWIAESLSNLPPKFNPVHMPLPGMDTTTSLSLTADRPPVLGRF